MSTLTAAIAHTYLPSILANLPYEWRGTTFANSLLLGREVFSANVEKLLLEKHAKNESTVSEAELTALGNAEDYLRVSTNISALLEMVLGLEVSLPTRQVFTFGSRTMPIIAVLLTAKLPVFVYVEEGTPIPFDAEQTAALALLGANVTIVSGQPVADSNAVVVSLQSTPKKVADVDAIVTPNSTLYIHNSNKINPDDVLVIRKRLATPLTTPVCEKYLQKIAGSKVTADADVSTSQALEGFYSHLQTMSGTSSDATANPVVFTAGLPSVCSLWLSLLHGGGADILMASTAYGGSSQLTDIFVNRSNGRFHKWTFDITGKNKISESIKNALDNLKTAASAPTTVLFVEIPTNPDMKVPDMATLAQHLTEYRNATGKEVLLLVDTTFAPASKVMEKMSAVAPDLTTMVFISMSKSVSRGYTTAGTIIANTASEKSRKLLETVRWVGALLDTTAKKDQLWRLTENHVGVEERCIKAYEVAVTAGKALQGAVAKYANGYSMDLAFVSEQNAAEGFTTSTFSFNLPPLANATVGENYAIAQRFVDILTAHKSFKPCVSFGQDNGLIYCTVPSTSTQGAIKAEDKAKQSVGGVDLTRLSFSPNCDLEAVLNIRVVVRVRPPLPSEKAHSCNLLVPDNQKKSIRLVSNGQPKEFLFDNVFAPTTTQDDIFTTTGIGAMIASVLDGFHATIFAYGQTGSGKTFTMEGYEYQGHALRVSDTNRVEAKPKLDVSSTRLGIVPRVIMGLFDAVNSATKEKAREFSIKCSFVQIYNEQILDLLSPQPHKSKPLRLRWASNEEFYVENLLQMTCSSAEEMLARFHDGVKQKIMATHNLNAASSRSHCIYTLYVESVDPVNPDETIKAKLSLVDLAGSERIVKTGATGVTLQESIGINKSLFVLRQVIQTLSDESQGKHEGKAFHVPYRDSKLTALLKHSLGGNSITLMIACLSPSDAYVDENLSTLVYAARTQSISNKPVKNEDPRTLLIQKLKDEVVTLKAQLAQAQQVIVELSQTGDARTDASASSVPVESTQVASPSITAISNQNESSRAIVPSGETKVPLESKGNKQLKMNVIDNVALMKSMVENERQLRSEVEQQSTQLSMVKSENRTLNIENQSLRERMEVLEYLVVGKGNQPEDDDAERLDLVQPAQERVEQVLRSCIKPSRSQGSMRPKSTTPTSTVDVGNVHGKVAGMLSISELRHLLHKKDDKGRGKKRNSAKVAPPPSTILQPTTTTTKPTHPVTALLSTLETHNSNNNSALEQDSLESLSELNRLLRVKAALKHSSASR